MNRDKAIEWCKNSLHYWPKTTKFPAPEGWEWYMRNKPYQLPRFILKSHDQTEITEGDVYS